MNPMQRAITNAPHNVALAGHWSVIARPPRQAPISIATFRGLPTEMGSMGFTDPFGPSQLQLNLPGVTLFDRLGHGDLYWANKHVDVDVIWTGDLPAGYPFGMHTSTGVVTPAFRWEGYIARFDPKTTGLGIQLKGTMLQLDRWLAKPEYPARPLPYEWAIQRQFLSKPALRMHPLRILWPSWWDRTYTAIKGKPSYLIPAGVSNGQKWTGLLTRSTGNFDATLTSYIQSMLASMYTDRGRWSLELDINRQPVLLHRDFVHQGGPGVVVIDPADPGVDINLSEDWEQAITTVYSQGTSLSGVAYTGMQVSADGELTSYRPAAAQRQVWPPTDNDWFDDQVMPAEVMLQTQQGLSADDAAIVARAHLARFGDPGLTGTITLKTDPLLNGVALPRMLVRAGMDIHVPRLFGRTEGVVMHVSSSEANFADGSVSLTVDTKQRDALTVDEVRLRGRDSLQISRMLVAGQYNPPIPDQMMPWSYAEGSGYIPSNPLYNALPLFNGMPDTVTFPWTDWTKQRPPKSSRWRNCYLRIGPASSNANDNWAVQHSSWGSAMGVPIKVGQAGTIRLLQVAAYDANGDVLKVPFHISFYYVGSVNVLSMPAIPVAQASMFPPYAPNQRYPFVRDAFEAFLIDGTRSGKNDPTAYQAAQPIRIYGTFYEKAGYYPGSYSDGDEPTGLLVDEGQWQWDLSGTSDSDIWDPYSVEKNLTSAHSGNIYAMIYCDAQQDQEVFFMGRMFRLEPGVGGQS